MLSVQHNGLGHQYFELNANINQENMLGHNKYFSIASSWEGVSSLVPGNIRNLVSSKIRTRLVHSISNGRSPIKGIKPHKTNQPPCM